MGVIRAMIRIPGYDLTETLRESGPTMVLRGREVDTGASVLVKALNQEYPETEDIARLKREHELLHRVDSPYVVKVRELVKHGRGQAIVMEAPPGEPLNNLEAMGSVDLADFLSLGEMICRGLAEIHSKQFVHGDVCPASIIWDREGNGAKIIDCGFAKELMPGTNAIPASGTCQSI